MNPNGQIYMYENTAHGFIHGKKLCIHGKKSIHSKMRVMYVNIVFNGKHILHLKRGDGNYGTFIE
jgi:hypothetical protein